jgi:hypothetical protein
MSPEQEQGRVQDKGFKEQNTKTSPEHTCISQLSTRLTCSNTTTQSSSNRSKMSNFTFTYLWIFLTILLIFVISILIYTNVVGGKGGDNDNTSYKRKQRSSIELTKVEIPNMKDQITLISLINQYKPILILHPEEKFLPSSTSYFINNTILETYKNDQDQIEQRYAVKNDTLLCKDCDEMGFLNGDLSTKELYTVAMYKPLLNVVDVAYWYFFPYNRGKSL